MNDTPPPLPNTAEPQPPVPERPLPVPWAWWEPAAVYVFSFLTSSVIAALILAATKDHNWRQAGFIVGYSASLLAWSLLWVRLRHGASPATLGIRRDNLAADIAAGVGWGLAAWAIAVPVVGTITVRIVDAFTSGKVPEPRQIDLTTPSAVILAVTAMGVIILAPLAEETLFRGMLFQGFRRWIGFVPSLMLSGALFMSAHAPTWIIFPSVLALALFLGWLVERRRSIIPCVVAHMLFNTIGFFAYVNGL